MALSNPLKRVGLCDRKHSCGLVVRLGESGEPVWYCPACNETLAMAASEQALFGRPQEQGVPKTSSPPSAALVEETAEPEPPKKKKSRRFGKSK